MQTAAGWGNSWGRPRKNAPKGASNDRIGGFHDIWTRIDGAMPGEIVEGLTARYETSAGDIETAVTRFLDELQREGLIVPDQADTDEKERPGRTAAGPERPLPRFETPVLHKYSDMQDLLLLDPIHDVDDAGWPMLKSNADTP
ncbi:MAG: PqqD family protein [Bacillati bacterium ANGP1]|uniref:PqqD family protein n=1 Tax=Candidatus Segetimicrobium genomatis TaxID=2569760 RepID=A0A537IZL4_9BACT|nr:MAG: PqqD family protein [Terrabacteria group bacterium ANGP1]